MISNGFVCKLLQGSQSYINFTEMFTWIIERIRGYLGLDIKYWLPTLIPVLICFPYQLFFGFYALCPLDISAHGHACYWSWLSISRHFLSDPGWYILVIGKKGGTYSLEMSFFVENDSTGKELWKFKMKNWTDWFMNISYFPLENRTPPPSAAKIYCFYFIHFTYSMSVNLSRINHCCGDLFSSALHGSHIQYAAAQVW